MIFDPRDTWVAIDFETATRHRSSACALGLAVIQDGRVVSQREWLIRPPGNVYESMNTLIHGLRPVDTRRAPSFDAIWEELRPYVAGRRILAHSAAFDVSVLRALIASSRLEDLDASYACSCTMARRAFPHLENHQLPTVCSHCGIDLEHHDAGSDAAACAQIALRCRDAVGAATIQEALPELGLELRRL